MHPIYCLFYYQSNARSTFFTVQPTLIVSTKRDHFSRYTPQPLNFREAPSQTSISTGTLKCGPATCATTLTSAAQGTAQVADMRPATNAIQRTRRPRDDALSDSKPYKAPLF